MPHYFATQSTTHSVNTYSKGSTDTYTTNLVGLSILCFPLALLTGIITYKKCRAAIFRRRVATLEKIWLIDIKNNTYRQD